MNFGGNFRRVGSANVEATKTLLHKLSDESWYQDLGGASENSADDSVQLIYLVHDEQFRHDQPVKRPALEVFGKVIRPILAIVADHFDSSQEGQRLSAKYGAGYFIRARFLRVSGNSTVAESADTTPSESCAHRVHVPILTSSDVFFTVNDESLCLPEGEVYEVNNLSSRSIKNGGESPCVHLLLDYVLDRQLAG